MKGLQAARLTARLPPQPRSLHVVHAPDGPLLAYSTEADLVLLHGDLRVNALLPIGVPVVSLALDAQHGVAVLSKDRKVQTFKLDGDEWRRGSVLEGVDDDAVALAWRASGELLVGRRLYRYSHEGAKDNSPSTWSEQWALPMSSAAVAFAQFSMDASALFIVPPSSRCAKLWSALEASNGAPNVRPAFVYLPHPAPIVLASWCPSPLHRLLLTTCSDGSTRLWAEAGSAPHMLLSHVFNANSRVCWLAPPSVPSSPLSAPPDSNAPLLHDALSARLASAQYTQSPIELLLELSAASTALYSVSEVHRGGRPKCSLIAKTEGQASMPINVYGVLLSPPPLSLSTTLSLQANYFQLDNSALHMHSLSLSPAVSASQSLVLELHARLKHVGHAAPIVAIALHPHCSLLLSLDSSNIAILWHAHLPSLPSAHAPLSAIISFPVRIKAFAWMPDAPSAPPNSARIAVLTLEGELILYALLLATPHEEDDNHDITSSVSPLRIQEDQRLSLNSSPSLLAAIPALLCLTCASRPSEMLIYQTPPSPSSDLLSVPVSSRITALHPPDLSLRLPYALLSGHTDGTLSLWQHADAPPYLQQLLQLSTGSAPLSALVVFPSRIAAVSSTNTLYVFESESTTDGSYTPEPVSMPAPSPSSSSGTPTVPVLLPYAVLGASTPSLVVNGDACLRVLSLHSSAPFSPFSLSWLPYAAFGPLPGRVSCATTKRGWIISASGAELLVFAPWTDGAASSSSSACTLSSSIPLPWYHPTIISELLLSANLPSALLLLRYLHSSLSFAPSPSVRSLPPLSLSVLLEGRTPDPPANANAPPPPPPVRSLLDDDMILPMSTGGNASSSVLTDDALLSSLESLLSTRVRLEELGRAEQRSLFDCIRAAQQLVKLQRAVDAPASRLLARRVLHGSAPLSSEECYGALLSDARALLVEQLLPVPPAPLEWAQAKSVGIGYWLVDVPLIRNLFERLAKGMFAARRQPNEVALFYLALGKRSALAALYRAAKDERLAAFFAQDFTTDRIRTTAHKNAYALLAQQRLELAAAFFLAAGSPRDALSALLRPTGQPPDIQLALLLARIADADAAPPNSAATASATAQGPLAMQVLRDYLLPNSPDVWTSALAHTLLNERPTSLQLLLSHRSPSTSAPALLFAARHFRTLLSADDEARLSHRAASAYVHARSPLLALLLTRSAPAPLLKRAAQLSHWSQLLHASPASLPSRINLLTQLNTATASDLPTASDLYHAGALSAAVASSQDPAQRRRWTLHVLHRLASLPQPSAFALLSRLGPALINPLLQHTERHVLATVPLVLLSASAAALLVRTSRLARALASNRWGAALKQLKLPSSSAPISEGTATTSNDTPVGEEQEEDEDEEEEIPSAADAWAATCIVAASARTLSTRLAEAHKNAAELEEECHALNTAEKALTALAAHTPHLYVLVTRPEFNSALARIGANAQLLWAATAAAAFATSNNASAPSAPIVAVVPSSPGSKVAAERKGLWSAAEELYREPHHLLQSFAASPPLYVCASESAVTELRASNAGAALSSRTPARSLVAQSMEPHPSAARYAIGCADGSLLVCKWSEGDASPVPVTLRPAPTPPLLSSSASSIHSLRWVAQGTRLVTAERNGAVCVWRADASSRAPLLSIAAHSEHALDVVCLSASLLATCGTGKRPVALWDLLAPPHRSLAAALTAPAGERGVSCLSADPTHAVLYAGTKDGALLVFDLRTYRLLHSTNAAHSRAVKSMDMSVELGTLATGGSDGQLKLWHRSAASEALRSAESWEAHKEQTFVRPAYSGVFHHPVATYGVTHVRFVGRNALLSSGADGRLVQRTFVEKNSS